MLQNTAAGFFDLQIGLSACALVRTMTITLGRKLQILHRLMC